MSEALETETQESLLTGKEPTDPSQQEVVAQAAAEGEQPEGKQPEGEEPESQGAPEQYEQFAMPEGVELNEEALVEFQAVAKELDLTQAEAQRFADIGASMVQQAVGAAVEGLQEQWTNTLSEWVEEIKADKELGGDKLPQTLAVARKAISTFGDEGLMQTLEETGMTNNPALLRFAHRIGKAMSEDTLHLGRSGSDTAKSAAQLIYPTMQ